MNEATASAPGKFVILGEHAVVYGKPAIALAIDRRISVSVREGVDFRVNGEPSDLAQNPHMRHIMEAHGMRGAWVRTDSRIPPGSGLGSSAALSAAFSMAARSVRGLPVEPRDIAADAFEAEYRAQGRGSPMDTSASVHGMGVALNIPGEKELWSMGRDGKAWSITGIDVPEMTFVIGYTGIRAATGPMVEKVRRYRDKSRFAADLIDEIGRMTLEGMGMVRRNDVAGLGPLMTEDHKLLSILGVSCRELDRLVDASLPYSYGAKLTGSGGGGSMVALTDKPEKVCEAIASRGGAPFVVRTGEGGVSLTAKDFR